jgi:hypothetical protein
MGVTAGDLTSTKVAKRKLCGWCKRFRIEGFATEDLRHAEALQVELVFSVRGRSGGSQLTASLHKSSVIWKRGLLALARATSFWQ